MATNSRQPGSKNYFALGQVIGKGFSSGNGISNPQ
jgi:hypothetical protein